MTVWRYAIGDGSVALPYFMIRKKDSFLKVTITDIRSENDEVTGDRR